MKFGRSSLTAIEHRDEKAISLRCSATKAGAALGAQSAASKPPVRSNREIYRPLTQDGIHGDDGVLRRASDDDTSWRATFTAVSRSLENAVWGLAAGGEAAFPRYLFAVMSWIMAQVLEGCIAFAEAMYSVDLSEPTDCRDPAGSPQPERGDRYE
jgi:hypothetical protein